MACVEVERLTEKQQAIFPADDQPPNNAVKGQRVKAGRVVKVKVEKPSDDESDGDDDEDDGGPRIGQDNTRAGKRIYKKALKILKLKLYFENFFPSDTEKDSLPYDCWSAAVASMGEIDGGPAAAKRLFYDVGYDKKARALAGSSTLYEHCDSHHPSRPIAREAYQLYQERVRHKVQGLSRAILLLTGEKIRCSQRRPLCLPRRPCEYRLHW